MNTPSLCYFCGATTADGDCYNPSCSQHHDSSHSQAHTATVPPTKVPLDQASVRPAADQGMVSQKDIQVPEEANAWFDYIETTLSPASEEMMLA